MNENASGATTSDVSPVGEDILADRPRKIRENRKYAKAVHEFAIAEQIARLLLGHRMEHHLTQKQLAAVLDMTVSEVSRLEGGEHTPNGATIDHILSRLNKHIVFVDNPAEDAREFAHA